jgi:hypothetical protein
MSDDLDVVVDEDYESCSEDDEEYIDHEDSSIKILEDIDSGFMEPLHIDWDILPVDEVAEFFRVLSGGVDAGDKDMAKTINVNLWALCCCIARDCVTVSEESMRANDRDMVCDGYFKDAVANLKLKIQFRDFLFKYCGGSWPSGFLDFLEDKEIKETSAENIISSPPAKRANIRKPINTGKGNLTEAEKSELSKKFTKSQVRAVKKAAKLAAEPTANLGFEAQKKIAFGKKIWDASAAYRSNINQQMNPKWVESENAAGRSGVASNTARFLAIRQAWFPMDCKIRSETNVRQLESRKKKGDKKFRK